MKSTQHFLKSLVSAPLVGFLTLGGLFQANLIAGDHSSVQMKGDGTKLIQDADGSLIQIDSDGTKTIIKPDGSSVKIKPS